MNLAISRQKFMQVDWDNWLSQHYPKFNRRAFLRCLQEVREWGLSTEEFQYLVLGCGHLFYVQQPDPEIKLEEIKREVSKNFDLQTVDLILDEKAIRKKILRLGPVIGPEQRPLSMMRKRGPRLILAPKIAGLAAYIWIRKKRPMLDPAELVCHLYDALSGRPMQGTTFARIRKKAEQTKMKIYSPAEQEISTMEHLVSMLEQRYERFKKEGVLMHRLDSHGLLDVYPISGVLEGVLKAVDVELPQLPQPPNSILRAFRPMIPKTTVPLA